MIGDGVVGRESRSSATSPARLATSLTSEDEPDDPLADASVVAEFRTPKCECDLIEIFESALLRLCIGDFGCWKLDTGLDWDG